mmetsp:Transcript_10581/g.28970  ORF Transcript_10581/g.28970 Transcript_10581/m.28970 type:complete len:237 (-) Transcript_10581:590-1300(-)
MRARAAQSPSRCVAVRAEETRWAGGLTVMHLQVGLLMRPGISGLQPATAGQVLSAQKVFCSEAFTSDIWPIDCAQGPPSIQPCNDEGHCGTAVEEVLGIRPRLWRVCQRVLQRQLLKHDHIIIVKHAAALHHHIFSRFIHAGHLARVTVIADIGGHVFEQAQEDLLWRKLWGLATSTCAAASTLRAILACLWARLQSCMLLHGGRQGAWACSKGETCTCAVSLLGGARVSLGDDAT